MAAVINTNIASLNTQRNLGTSQSQLNTSIQRLSSGLRINSAKDDAAGLAISERMNAQIRGLNVAARNANDGVSLAQTAEGALGKVGDMLQRMRELAVQSANATNSTSDRTALNAEVSQLKEEIQRVADTTKFNGTALLDGNFTDQNFQVGANSGETITLSEIANANLTALGTLQTAGDTYFATVTGAVPTGTGAMGPGDMIINGVDIAQASGGLVLGGVGYPAQGANIAAAIDALKTTTGVSATADASGAITLTSTSATGIEITSDHPLSLPVFYSLSVGTTPATPVAGTTEPGIANLSVATPEQAAWALDAIDSALDQVNTARGTLGAVQSRFESAVSNIQIQSENLSAARSRIVDADFAAETASLTRGQILQQAGTAMLAQANQLPNNVLSLLR